MLFNIQYKIKRFRLILRNLHNFELCARAPLANSPKLAHGNWEKTLFVTRGTSLSATKESLFCH